MSTLERPFIEAVSQGEIEGAILEGRDKSGTHYSNTFGKRTLPDGTEKSLSTNDLVFLASATKFLTTVAALQCCDRNLLSLNADLATHLPDLVKQGVLTGHDDTTGAANIEPLRKPLTLRHLLTHSSGIVYFFFDPILQRWQNDNPKPEGPLDVPSRLTQPLRFQPGEGWMYGPGIDWAGYLVEKVTGLELDEYFRKHLCEPLGIPATDISFFPVKEGLGDRMPDLSPSDPLGNGLAAVGSAVNPEGTTACFGGHGAYATSELYVAVLNSLLKNDGKLLRTETVEAMCKPQLEPNAQASLAAALQGPMGPFFAQNTTGSNQSFGLGGLLVGKEGDGGMGQGSLTWGGGFNSAWLLDRSNGVCGFVCPQLKVPSSPMTALPLKEAFRKGIGEQLRSMKGQ